MPGSCRGRGRGRKESPLANTASTEGHCCLGDNTTLGALEGWGGSLSTASLASLLGCWSVCLGRDGVAQLAHKSKIPLPDVKFNSHRSLVAEESL